MYADHPSRKLDFEDEVDTPEGASPRLQATEEALEESPLGCSVDGRSRRIRKRYLCSLGERQIPPAVRQEMHLRRINRKRGQYRQRMERQRKQADVLMLQAELEIPTVEALMACPLSKFIHFAANDCGYRGTRYELIANWVHPLFLKAKSEASKEDNPSWKQAMNGPFKKEYWDAAR
jgi:hypothetical protein